MAASSSIAWQSWQFAIEGRRKWRMCFFLSLRHICLHLSFVSIVVALTSSTRRKRKCRSSLFSCVFFAQILIMSSQIAFKALKSNVIYKYHINQPRRAALAHVECCDEQFSRLNLSLTFATLASNSSSLATQWNKLNTNSNESNHFLSPCCWRWSRLWRIFYIREKEYEWKKLKVSRAWRRHRMSIEGLLHEQMLRESRHSFHTFEIVIAWDDWQKKKVLMKPFFFVCVIFHLCPAACGRASWHELLRVRKKKL